MKKVIEKVKLGIIGLGVQGSAYAKLISDGKVDKMILGAVCDTDPKRRESAKKEYPHIPIYGDYIEMMESGGVDAVITTVLHYLHPTIGIEALKRDIPVICEKPAGVYTKQVKKLNEYAASKPQVPFAIMFNQRTNPLYQEVKRIVESGEIGAIRRTNWIINSWWRIQAYYDQSPWRATWGAEGGGVLINQAPHQLDMIQWICGMPKKVYAKAKFGLNRSVAVETDVTAILDYGNGATGVFVSCTHDAIGTDRFEIDGDKGKIVIEDSKRAVVSVLRESETEMNRRFGKDMVANLVSGGRPENLYNERVVEFPSAWGSQHCLVLENFANHILSGEPLLAKGEEGIWGVRLANAMLLSAWLGREVDYDFEDDLFVAELNKKIAEEGKYPLIEEI